MEHLSLQVGKTNLDQLKTGGYALMMMLMIVVVVSVVGVAWSYSKSARGNLSKHGWV